MGIGFCGLPLSEFQRISFRQLNYVIEAEVTRREDAWDHVRHIMAPWCGGEPKRIMRLKRDEVVVSVEEIERVKAVLKRIKETW